MSKEKKVMIGWSIFIVVAVSSLLIFVYARKPVNLELDVRWTVCQDSILASIRWI